MDHSQFQRDKLNHQQVTSEYINDTVVLTDCIVV